MNEQKTQRPRNMSIDPSRERFSDNSAHYFTFQRDMNFCFKTDCEKFLLAFEKLKSFSFRTFAGVWKDMSFSLIFAGQEFIDELAWFMESAFFTVKKYLIFSKSIYVQVGAFYMLYALYFKQPCSDKVKIRLTSEEYAFVSSLLQKMVERKMIEFEGIFTRLKCKNAFWYVAKPRRYGLEGKFMWQEKKLKDDIFQSTKKFDPVHEVKKVLFAEEFYGLKYVHEVDQEYTQALERFGINTTADHQMRSITEDLKLLYNKMKGSPSKQAEKKGDKEETIDVKRAKLRSKAFTATVPRVRCFDTENTYKKNL